MEGLDGPPISPVGEWGGWTAPPFPPCGTFDDAMTRVTREHAASVDAARARYVLWDYDHTPFPAGARILDIGCGDGAELRTLVARGCGAIGIDVTMAPDSAVPPKARVLLARAEHLPFRDASFDGAVMKVVLPYTDERVAVREVARVLRPAPRGS